MECISWNSDFLDYHNSLSLDVQVGVESCTNNHQSWLEFIFSLSIKPQCYFFLNVKLIMQNVNNRKLEFSH